MQANDAGLKIAGICDMELLQRDTAEKMSKYVYP